MHVPGIPRRPVQVHTCSSSKFGASPSARDRRCVRRVILAVAFLIVLAPAGEEDHWLIGLIAEQCLTLAARAKIAELLGSEAIAWWRDGRIHIARNTPKPANGITSADGRPDCCGLALCKR